MVRPEHLVLPALHCITAQHRMQQQPPVSSNAAKSCTPRHGVPLQSMRTSDQGSTDKGRNPPVQVARARRREAEGCSSSTSAVGLRTHATLQALLLLPACRRDAKGSLDSRSAVGLQPHTQTNITAPTPPSHSYLRAGVTLRGAPAAGQQWGCGHM